MALFLARSVWPNRQDRKQLLRNNKAGNCTEKQLDIQCVGQTDFIKMNRITSYLLNEQLSKVQKVGLFTVKSSFHLQQKASTITATAAITNNIDSSNRINTLGQHAAQRISMRMLYLLLIASVRWFIGHFARSTLSPSL